MKKDLELALECILGAGEDVNATLTAFIACVARGRILRGIPLTNEEGEALHRDSELESRRQRNSQVANEKLRDEFDWIRQVQKKSPPNISEKS